MQHNKPILIVGSGPSASYGQAGRLAKGCEVARTNWFFLEKQQIFGKQVDYLFHATYALLINYIYYVLIKDNQVYCIDKNIDVNPSKSQRVKNILQDKMPKIDIHVPRTVDNSSRSSCHATTGLLMLKYFLEAGYKTIHIAGIDFYQGEYSHLNVKNAKILKLTAKRMRNAHIVSAYDIICHSLQYDINYLKDLLTQYPQVKITATSCHPDTTKIWQQFKQVKVIEFPSHQTPELYDAYLDKPWLRKAVDDCARKYGFRANLKSRIRRIRLGLKALYKNSK